MGNLTKTWSFFLILFVMVGVNGKNYHSKYHNEQPGAENKRIVGGEKANIHNYPYQVAIVQRRNPGYNFVCGGSIISDQHILTAAHCISYNLLVVLGTTSLNSHDKDTQIIPAKYYFRHPDYLLKNNVAYNDIAVLKLEGKIMFNENIRKIDLPALNSEPSSTIAIVSGWGYLSKSIDVSVQTNTLMAVDVPIITNYECRGYYNHNIEDTQLCTLSNNLKGTCSGDSGGPLVQDGKLIGVVSWGEPWCDPKTPSVYTKVSKFVEWINQHLKY